MSIADIFDPIIECFRCLFESFINEKRLSPNLVIKHLEFIGGNL